MTTLRPQIKPEVDVSGVDKGFDKVKVSAKTMATNVVQSLDSVGKSAVSALPADKINSKFSSLARSVSRQISTMEREAAKLSAGGYGTVEFFRNLAQIQNVSSAQLAKLEPQFERLAAAQKRLAVSGGDVAGSFNRITAATGETANKLRFQTGMIAAQFQDIGVTAAMGMNPMMIALQQGTQLAGQFQASGANLREVVRGLGGAFASLVNPVSLVSIGFTAVVAAGLQMIDWSAVARKGMEAVAGALKLLGDNIDTVVPVLGVLGAGLAAVYSPAILVAIGSVVTGTANVIASLGRLVAASTRAAAVMAVSNPFTALVAAVGLVGVALYKYSEQISQFFGVSGIGGIIKAGVEYIAGALVSTVNAAVNTVSAMGEAVKLSWNNVVAYATEGINKVIDLYNRVVGSFLGKKIELFQVDWAPIEAGATRLTEKLSAIPASFHDIRGTGASALQTVGTMVGDVGAVLRDSAVTVTDYMQSWVTGGEAAAKGVAKIKREVEILGEIQKPIADLNEKFAILDGLFARGAISASEYNVAVHRAEQELKNLQIGIIEADTKNKTFMQSAAEGFQKWALKSKDMALVIQDSVGTALTNLSNGVAKFVTGGMSSFAEFGNFVVGIIKQVAQQMLASGIMKLIGWVATGGLSGGGGVARTILSFFGFAKGAAFDNGVQKFASGGVVSKPTLFPMANGLGLMGEAGPEAVMPLKRLRSGRLGVESAGAAPVVKINIINQTATPVHAQIGVPSYNEITRQVVTDVILSDRARGGAISRAFGVM